MKVAAGGGPGLGLWRDDDTHLTLFFHTVILMTIWSPPRMPSALLVQPIGTLLLRPRGGREHFVGAKELQHLHLLPSPDSP